MHRSVPDDEVAKTLERVRSDLREEDRPTKETLRRFLECMSRELFPEDDDCVFWSGSFCFKNPTFSVGSAVFQTRRLIRFWFVEEFDLKGGSGGRRKIFRTCADDPTGRICCRTDHCIAKNVARPLLVFQDVQERKNKGPDKGTLVGTSHPSSKITRERVEGIWRDCTDGEKTGEIAKRHGVSTSTVHNIKSGRSWASVTGMTKEYEETQQVAKRRLAEKTDLKHDALVRELWNLDFRPGLPDDRRPSRLTMVYMSRKMGAPFGPDVDRCVPYGFSRLMGVTVTRRVYDWFVGDVPSESFVLRRCQASGGGSVNCVNPGHLQLSAQSRKRKR